MISGAKVAALGSSPLGVMTLKRQCAHALYARTEPCTGRDGPGKAETRKPRKSGVGDQNPGQDARVAIVSRRDFS
jgi:hypothetical protein